jgi:hypothetical protein
MKSSIEDFRTGWYGLKLHLDLNDIDRLLELLVLLKDDKNYHFHIFSTAFDDEAGGVADIEFCRKDESEKSNMDIGG